RLDAHVLPDRIADARKIVRLVRAGPEPHVLFYGFYVPGEESVNPQLLVSRLLLPLGWETFASRGQVFDHEDFLYFRFPIPPPGEAPGTLASLPVPFYVHVATPYYSVPSLAARYLNRSQVSQVDLGLTGFTSLRVEHFARPGPMPIPRRGPVPRD